MLFTISNDRYESIEQLRTRTLLDAYYIVRNYPMHAADLILEHYIQQQYGMSLRDMCVRLLLALTYNLDSDGNLLLLFKDPKDDKVARLITYGNGAIPGSKILKLALSD